MAGAAASHLQEVLTGPGTAGAVVAVHRRSLLVDVGGSSVTLLAGPGSLTPITVSVAMPLPRCVPGDPVVAGNGRLTIGGLTVQVRRWWDSRLRPVAPDPRRLGEFSRLISDHPPGLPPALIAAFAAELLSGQAFPVARRLVGRGGGSTPAGDDLLCGVLAALAAGGHQQLAARLFDAVAQLLPTTTALSAALLRAAGAGHAAVEALAVLRALAPRSPRSELAAAVSGLLALGHTSGADLAAGLLIGLGARGCDDDRPPASTSAGPPPVGGGYPARPAAVGEKWCCDDDEESEE